MDALTRDGAERLLKIIRSAAERRGQSGSVKAAKLKREFERHFEAEDESTIKSDMVAIVNHLTKPGYSTDSEMEELKELFPNLPQSVIERIKEGEEISETSKKTALTLPDMEQYLNEKRISLSYNDLTREFSNGGQNPDSLTTKAYSDLVNEYSRVTPDIIERYCAFIYRENTYNPILQRIGDIKWDGVDRMTELCEVMRIDPADELSRTLVKTWLCQTIALVFNSDENPIAGQGILVLQTPGNAGKSTLVRNLAFGDPTLYTDAKLRVGDRDSVAHITSKWLSELSEIGNIFRSNDPDALKQFLTSPKDTFRVPYGRHDETHARKVSFIGTLNPKGGDRRYLTDDGGERRYWTVVCHVNDGEQFDIERENELDMAQLWRQAFEMVKAHGEKAYRLTLEDTNLLVFRNREYMKPIPAEAELRDIIEQSTKTDRNGKKRYKTVLVTASEIRKEYETELKAFSAEKIGTALVKLGYISDRRRRYSFPVPIHASLSVYDGPEETAEP